jgi:hypothetical protein
MCTIRKAYNILIGKHEAKNPLPRPGRTWKNNIKFNIGQIGLENADFCEHGNELLTQLHAAFGICLRGNE